MARAAPATAGAALCLPLGIALALPAAPAHAAGEQPARTGTATGTTTGTTTGTRASVAARAEPDTAPLRVRISEMSRTTLPARGSITIRGTVTNRSEDTWTTVKLYAVDGTVEPLAPMTTSAELAAAMELPYEAYVGDRVVDEGETGTIDLLEPGDTASYEIEVPVDALALTPGDGAAPGVYWFGVHALGQGGALARDEVADGRARTFLPYVPRRTEELPASLVVPLTHAVLFAADGAVADEERWTERLSPGGRMHDLLALGRAAAAEGVAITWLVDPALLDAIGQLAAGNPPRSLAPTPAPGAGDPGEGDGGNGPDDPDDPNDPAGTEEPGTPEASPSEDPEAGAGEPDSPVAVAARGWLDGAADVFGSGEVATLPYGNPDLAATHAADPGLLDLALAQQSTVLASLGIESSPVATHPQGYVDAATAAAAPDDRPLLVGDRFLPGSTPTVARLDDQQLVVASSGAAQGSPGPGRSTTAVGLRQRILAEAAVRALSADTDTDPDTGPGTPDRTGDTGDTGGPSGSPLVVVLPTAWDLSDATELVDGLAPDWVDVGPLDAVTSGTPAGEVGEVTATDLVDPDGTAGQVRPLAPETFDAVRDLIETGDTLQRILVSNSEVGARVTEEALSGLSYSVRRQQRTARGALTLSRSWLEDQLGSVLVTASSGVTLSGDSGSFVVTLENNLDEPVRIGLVSVSDDEIDIEPIEPLELGAQSRTSVLLEVTTTTSRVHTVTLLVTDADGIPLGATDQLPIRSVLVSDVIWVIIGVGAGTLFLAIGLRLRRRIVAARSGAPEAGDQAPQGTSAAGTPGPAPTTAR